MVDVGVSSLILSRNRNIAVMWLTGYGAMLMYHSIIYSNYINYEWMNGNSGNRFTFDFASLEIVAEEQKLCMKTRRLLRWALFTHSHSTRRWRMDVVAGTGLDTSRRHSVWSGGSTSSASSPGRQTDITAPPAIHHHQSVCLNPPLVGASGAEAEVAQWWSWMNCCFAIFIDFFIFTYFYLDVGAAAVVMYSTKSRRRAKRHPYTVPSVMCWMVFSQYIKMEWCK